MRKLAGTVSLRGSRAVAIGSSRRQLNLFKRGLPTQVSARRRCRGSLSKAVGWRAENRIESCRNFWPRAGRGEKQEDWPCAGQIISPNGRSCGASPEIGSASSPKHWPLRIPAIIRESMVAIGRTEPFSGECAGLECRAGDKEIQPVGEWQETCWAEPTTRSTTWQIEL